MEETEWEQKNEEIGMWPQGQHSEEENERQAKEGRTRSLIRDFRCLLICLQIPTVVMLD